MGLQLTCKSSPHISKLSLSRTVVPLIQGFEDAGDFTVTERLKTSVHVNLLFYLILGGIGLFGLVLLIMMHKTWLVPSLAKMIYIDVDISIFLGLPSRSPEILNKLLINSGCCMIKAIRCGRNLT